MNDCPELIKIIFYYILYSSCLICEIYLFLLSIYGFTLLLYYSTVHTTLLKPEIPTIIYYCIQYIRCTYYYCIQYNEVLYCTCTVQYIQKYKIK